MCSSLTFGLSNSLNKFGEFLNTGLSEVSENTTDIFICDLDPRRLRSKSYSPKPHIKRREFRDGK